MVLRFASVISAVVAASLPPHTSQTTLPPSYRVEVINRSLTGRPASAHGYATQHTKPQGFIIRPPLLTTNKVFYLFVTF